jgi:hypothetical protein
MTGTKTKSIVADDKGMSIEEVRDLDFAFQFLGRISTSPRLMAEKVHIPSDLRWRIWERDNFTCHYCGSRRKLAVDHVVPESRGGELVVSNLVTSCRRCNSVKSTSSYGWMLASCARSIASWDKRDRAAHRAVAMQWIERCISRSFLFEGEQIIEGLRAIFLDE